MSGALIPRPAAPCAPPPRRMRRTTRMAPPPRTQPAIYMATCSNCGFQNSATGLDLGFYAARSYALMMPAEDGSALDPRLGKARDRVLGPRPGRLAGHNRASAS